MEKLLYLSLVTACLSFTVSEAKIFLPVRVRIKKKSSFLGELFCCGYCLGHWVAFSLVAIYQPRIFTSWWLLGYFLTALVIAWLSAFQYVLLCWLMERAGK
jgi:Protein of unknown function (DUF1360)